MQKYAPPSPKRRAEAADDALGENKSQDVPLEPEDNPKYVEQFID